ncbi:MAG: tripartite tricarboxylate transporter TctB family protein [Pseudomonadota bacterium]
MTSPIKLKAALVPVLMVVVGLVWAVLYYRSVATDPRQDEAALSLIGPLIWVLVPLGVLTAAQAVFAALGGSADETHGLDNRKRLIYLAALACLLAALPWLGLLGAGLPFFALLAYLLGFRRILWLILLTAGLGVLIWGGFAGLLDISLPLYPGQRP